MGHRTWIKLYCEKWLRGSLREDTPSVRGLWADILAMAGDFGYGEAGIIKVADRVGLTDEQLAGICCCPLEEWQQAKGRLVETDRIRVNEGNIIEITNWTNYQSEYQRQKPYRDQKVPVDPDKYTKGKYGQNVKR